jgi:hypothetical protein
VRVVETQAHLSNYCGYRAFWVKVVESFATSNPTLMGILNKLEVIHNVPIPIEDLSRKPRWTGVGNDSGAVQSQAIDA